MKNLSAASCFTLFAIVCALALGSFAGAQTVKVDPAVPSYAKAAGVSGNIDSVGSDTMNNLMTFWCEGFAKFYPNVRCQIEGKGSSTAPPALIAGTSQFGPMSRKMKSKEIDAFEKETGYKPTAVPTSIDALAVYVNKDNPVGCLSIKQVDAIFSKNRKCGGGSDISTWGAAGLGGRWSGRPISVYGRNSASGTYGYFKKKALCRGDYKDTVKEQPGSSAVRTGNYRGSPGNRLQRHRVQDFRSEGDRDCQDRREGLFRTQPRECRRREVSARKVSLSLREQKAERGARSAPP